MHSTPHLHYRSGSSSPDSTARAFCRESISSCRRRCTSSKVFLVAGPHCWLRVLIKATTCCDSISLPFMLSRASDMPFTFSAMATRVSWISFLRDFTAAFVAFSKSSTITSRASCASTARFRIFTVSSEMDFSNWINSGAPVAACCKKAPPGTSRQRRSVSTTLARIFSIISWLESTVLNRVLEARISSVTRFSSSSIAPISSCISFKLAFSCWFSAFLERTSALS
mmetsp:Transcript_46630/g.101323  ORF Transcript_46630/g.101323 Transcript_46630/m.101323 type:complete len:226 (-) Transcript_46630:1333-2010(-)